MVSPRYAVRDVGVQKSGIGLGPSLTAYEYYALFIQHTAMQGHGEDCGWGLVAASDWGLIVGGPPAWAVGCGSRVTG
jgi:hypothetical protein